MELKTIRQVSQDFGISRQMLCYYEKIGLIKSDRKNDYAYRVYDESEIKRLQQIIILRKLQIPMKQIKDILNNQNAVAVIEIFEQNISELDDQITALSAVRSMLVRFADELREKADINLKLDLLNDTTMLAIVNALSFSENKIKEKVTMDELNQASEQMNKLADKDVRIVFLPSVMVAQAYDPDDNPDIRDNPYDGATKSIMQKFVDEVNLFKIKPDTRIFAWGDTVNGKRVEIMWATIPDDLDVPAPLTKERFDGGLYAMTSSYTVSVGEWIANSGKYEWNRIRKHNQGMEELINPISIFGMNIDSETNGFMYVDNLMPVKEIKQWSSDSINTALAELNKLFSWGKSTDIDLTGMVKHGNFELSYVDRLMVIKGDGFEGWERGMATVQQFKFPLKINLRAKTDSTDIVIRYAQGGITFQDMHLRDTLCVDDIKFGSEMHHFHNKCGEVPADEFVDIEWIIGKEVMAVKVNGELRRIGDDYGYITAFKESPDFNILSAVTVTTIFGATLTVEKLSVIEI